MIAQPLGYICLTIFVILICWYFLFGDFKVIKKGGKILIKAGATS
jgi:urea transporter